LIKIKTGYLNFHWDGNYSFLSEKWTQELRDKLGYNHNDPNSFWISLSDF